METEKIREVLGRPVRKIREINRRYSTPRIKMTRWVKFSLLILRIYLLTIVILLLYKLLTTFRIG